MKNFDFPFFSRDLPEFWKKWHISLTSWFVDYIYIPLGGSRKGKYKTYLNLFIVFLVSGLWHGAAMTFVIWGAIHGSIIVFEKAIYKQRFAVFNQLSLKPDSTIGKFVFIPIIFTIVCFAWIFFRSNSLKDAFVLISNINLNNIENIYNGKIYELGLVKFEFIFSLISVGILIIFEWYHKKINVHKLIKKQLLPVRWSLYMLIVFTLLIFGIYGDDQVSEFIYFQF